MDNRVKRLCTVRGKLALTLICVSLLVAAFTAYFSARSARDRVYAISTKLSEKTVEHAGTALTEYVEDLQNLSNDFMRSPELQAIASASSAVSPSPLSMAAATQLQGASGSAASFDFLAVFLANGTVYETRQEGFLPYGDYETCLEYWQDALPQQEDYIRSRWVLEESGSCALYLRFVYEPLSMRRLGIALFGVELNRFDQLYSGYGVEGFLTTNQGAPLSRGLSRQHQATLEAIAPRLGQGGQLRSLSYTDSKGTERIVSLYSLWQLGAYLVVPFDYYETSFSSQMADYTRSVMGATALALVLATVLSLLLSRGLTRSLTALYEFTQTIGLGDTQLRFRPKTRDEIGLLGIKLNGMLDRLQALAKQREDDLLANQLMELQLMQQQINPHLLYNTLDSLLWVLQQERTQDARQLVQALSEFFKISLSRGSEIITLGEELQLIRHYLDLQRLARNRHIRLETQLEPGLERHPLIKLLLQPLVENAIIHGFSGYQENGIITLRAFREGQALHILLRDNGIGLMEQEVERINGALAQKTRPECFPHFGLWNIHRRIVRTYGSDYGIRLVSELSVFTEIRMTLPYLLEETL